MNDFKTDITEHAYSRLKERLDKMVTYGDITSNEAKLLESNLNEVLRKGFNQSKSFGIKIGKFQINPESSLVTRKHKTGIYYEINSADQYDVIKDSTGNEFWVVIRNNRLVTAFLRKTIQRNTAKQPRDMGGLGVDIIIDDINKFS